MKAKQVTRAANYVLLIAHVTLAVSPASVFYGFDNNEWINYGVDACFSSRSDWLTDCDANHQIVKCKLFHLVKMFKNWKWLTCRFLKTIKSVCAYLKLCIEKRSKM